MKTVLLLTKDDININRVGFHIEITTTDGTAINLNPEAFKELYNDLKSLIIDEESAALELKQKSEYLFKPHMEPDGYWYPNSVVIDMKKEAFEDGYKFSQDSINVIS